MRILGTVASSSREVPNAPTIGTATNVGTGRAYNNGSATVTFTAPTFDGGLPITSYTATSSPGGFTASGASSPLAVTGLQSATAYTFTVTATNSRGTGAASAASNSITATTVPQAPTIGTATDAGTGTSATVTYTAGATGGAAVSVYTATSSPGSLTGTGASPITVSGLTTGTAYTFTVTATNANGTSTASAASNSVTPASPSSYESIATVTSTATASISFTSIPSTFKNLQIRSAITQSATSPIRMRFNSDSGSNYAFHYLDGSSAGIVSAGGFSSFNRIVMAASPGINNTYPTNIIIDIVDYQSTSKYKTVRILLGYDTNNTAGGVVELCSALWMSTSAISSITIEGDGSGTITGLTSLYGIKG
jgi:hypothetical protein